MERRVDELIRSLELVPHPEGGFYREVWRSAQGVAPEDGRGRRAGLTAIHFLLPAGAVSRWHRVRSDELWQHQEGAPLELLRAPPDARHLERVRLGSLAEAGTPMHGVPAGWWQAAESLGAYSLVACSVGPGFDFADFELLADDEARAEAFCRAQPGAARFR